MLYTNNNQLLKEFKKLLIDNGIKQVDVADTLNMTRQALTSYLRKQHFTFDDLQRLLNACGYDLDFNFIRKE